MPAISLFGLGIAAKSPTVTAKLMTNFYAETRPAGEKSMLVAYGTPGLELFCDVLAPARGALEFEKNSVAYVVAGDVLWEEDGNGVKTNRGTLLTTSSRVSMAHNGVQIMIVDGTYGYIYNTSTVVFSQITDPDFPLNPTTCTYLSRRFIASFQDSSRFYVSDIDDGLSWDALMFANAESNPDPIVAVWSSTGQLILLGANTTEFWGNSGTLDFPFVALQGSANEWGLAAVSSIAKYDNTFACLIKNRMGQVMVASMNGYLPKKISTLDIDHIINAYFANQDAWGYSYMLGGHPFYVISFPSAAGAPAGTQGAPEAAAVTMAASPPIVALASAPPEPRVSYDGLSAPAGVGTAAVLSAINPGNGRIWACTNDISGGFETTLDVYITDDPSQSLQAHLTMAIPASFIWDIIYVAATDEMWVIAYNFAAHHLVFIYDATAETFTETVDLGARGTAFARGGAYNDVDEMVVIFCETGLFYPVTPSTRTVGADHHMTTTPVDDYIGKILVAGDFLGAFVSSGGAIKLDLIDKSDYSTAAVVSAPGSGLIAAYDPVRGRIIVGEGTMNFNVIELDTFTMTSHPLDIAADADPDYSIVIKSVAYVPYNASYVFGADATPSPKMTTLYIVDPSSLQTDATYTYEPYDGTRLLMPYLLTPVDDPNYLLSFDTTHIKRLYLGAVIPPPTPDPEPDADYPPDHVPYAGAFATPFDGTTWLYDGSTGFWSMLKSELISRHRVQFSYQCDGQTIGADYFNGKQYRITDTAYSDNGKMIEGEIIGETLTMGPDEAFLTVNKLRVGMEVGVGNTVAPGDNPQVALSVARDSGAKDYGPEMWKPLGRTGEVYARLEWRRLGTTRFFTPKIRITDPVKRVITGASVNPVD